MSVVEGRKPVNKKVLRPNLGRGYPLSWPGKGVPPPHQPDWGTPPPNKCGQTENITFPHPSDAGGNKILLCDRKMHTARGISCPCPGPGLGMGGRGSMWAPCPGPDGDILSWSWQGAGVGWVCPVLVLVLAMGQGWDTLFWSWPGVGVWKWVPCPRGRGREPWSWSWPGYPLFPGKQTDKRKILPSLVYRTGVVIMYSTCWNWQMKTKCFV